MQQGALSSATEATLDVPAGAEGVVAGPVLITGSTRGIGGAFADAMASARGASAVLRHGATARPRPGGPGAAESGEEGYVEVADLRDEAAMRALAARLERRCPGGLGGFVHFASTALDSAGMAGDIEESSAIIDVHLKGLVTMVGHLVPLMLRQAPHPCRIMTVSSGASLAGPSAWALPSGQRIGMYALVKSFVEQYTEALAHELRGTNITVCCARIEGTFRTELHDLTRSGAALPLEEILPALNAIWELPALEAHGNIIPARPSSEPTPPQLQGSNALGSTVDCRFALRTAVARASDYPGGLGPSPAYGKLAAALKIAENSLCWFHGSSDAILRCTTAAVGTQPSLPRIAGPRSGATLGDAAASAAAASEGDPAGRHTVVVQAPTWHNAARLLRDAGARHVLEVRYGDPWKEERGEEVFWEALEELLAVPDPPALVYLVRPHFPTGFNGAGFAERLGRVARSDAAAHTVFLVDQCYLGFVEASEEERNLEYLATTSDAVILVRSLSKVEGLAGVRLGYTVASPRTTWKLAAGLPFGGSLYVSELDLAGAVAAVCAPDAQERRDSVVAFYAKEREWLTNALEDLGLEVSPSVGPYGCVRGPEKVLDFAKKKGAQLLGFRCPTQEGLGAAQPPNGEAQRSACFLVDKHALNCSLVEKLREGIEEANKPQDIQDFFKLPWMK